MIRKIFKFYTIAIKIERILVGQRLSENNATLIINILYIQIKPSALE